MNRFILLAFAIQFSPAATVIADDYILRVDAIGYVDQPAGDKAPKESILRSVEVIARPQSAFHCKANIGKRSLTLAGELHPADCGDFKVRIRCIDSVDTGTTVPTEDGKRKPLLGTTQMETTVAIALGDSVIVGGFMNAISQSGKPERTSAIRYVLVLAKYDPTNES